MGRGKRAVTSRPAPPVFTIAAKLIGGTADGCTVEMPALAAAIFVHLDDDGCAHATNAGLAESASVPAGACFYRLVNHSGPEEPTYVAPTI